MSALFKFLLLIGATIVFLAVTLLVVIATNTLSSDYPGTWIPSIPVVIYTSICLFMYLRILIPMQYSLIEWQKKKLSI
jgi:hypothetical protein